MDTLEVQLMEAVRNENVELVESLLKRGCKVDVGDVDNFTPLHLAAMKDYIEIAKLLIDNGANVNCKTTDKMAPLHHAAVRGLGEMVAILVHGGANLDPLDANDRTPLLLAVKRNHHEVVEALVAYGAKINMEEIHGYTPLCEAVWNKRVDTVTLLLKAGAKLTQSHCLLHYSVLHRHLSMAELLLKYGAYPNLRDDSGDTPLLVAIACQHVEMVKLLLHYEANPNYYNSISGITPIVKASLLSVTLFEEVLSLLCKNNVDLNLISHTSGTPLTIVLETKRFDHAIALIRAGADVNQIGSMWLDWQKWQRLPWDHDFYRMESLLLLKHTFNVTGLIQLIVAAGFDVARYYNAEFPKDFSQVDTESLHGWLTFLKFNPRSLMDLCRLTVRSHMGSRAMHIIPPLPIPQSLKQFLLYRDIYVKEKPNDAHFSSYPDTLNHPN